MKQIFKILAAAPVTFARAPRAAQVGMVLFFAAAGLPWASGAAVSIAAALGLAVAARRHENK